MSPPYTLLVLLLTAASPPPLVVARVAGETITADEVRARLGDEPGAESLRAALVDLGDERVLAREARALLPDLPSTLAPDQAAARLLARLLDPAHACLRIPDPVRRSWYEETRWRFRAPPSWRVADLQLLCCSGPRACRDPAVAACLEAQGPEAQALATAVAGKTPAAVEGAVASLRERFPHLAFSRYRFYFDPERPDDKMDGRLQEVDREIAVAATALVPGGRAGPVRSRFGYHLLYLEGGLPGIDLPFEDPRTQALILTELCPGWLIEQRGRYLADLREGLPLELDWEALTRSFGPETTAALKARPPR